MSANLAYSKKNNTPSLKINSVKKKYKLNPFNIRLFIFWSFNNPITSEALTRQKKLAM